MLMDPSTQDLLKHFEAKDAAIIGDLGETFYTAAKRIAEQGQGPEAPACLRKLLEAKDCAVRAMLERHTVSGLRHRLAVAEGRGQP